MSMQTNPKVAKETFDYVAREICDIVQRHQPLSMADLLRAISFTYSHYYRPGSVCLELLADRDLYLDENRKLCISTGCRYVSSNTTL